MTKYIRGPQDYPENQGTPIDDLSEADFADVAQLSDVLRTEAEIVTSMHAGTTGGHKYRVEDLMAPAFARHVQWRRAFGDMLRNFGWDQNSSGLWRPPATF